MNTPLKRLGTISFRLMGNFYGKGITFAASVLIARWLGPEDMGHIRIVNSLYSMFLVVAGVHLFSAIATWSAQNPEERKTILYEGLGCILLAFMGALMVFQIVLNLFNPITDLVARDLFLRYMPFALVWLLLQVTLGVMQGNGKIMLMTIGDMVFGTVKSLILVGAVYYFGMQGWLQGRISGDILGFAGVALILVPVIRRLFAGYPFKLDKTWLRKFFRYYRWSFVSSGIGTLEQSLTALFVMWFIRDSAQVAFVGIATVFLVIFNQYSMAIGSTLFPEIAKLHQERPRLLRHLWKTQLLSGLPFFIFLAVLYPFVPDMVRLLYGAEYQPVGPLLQIVVFAAAFAHVSIINGGYWLALGRVEIQSRLSIISFIAFIPLSLGLLYYYGIEGLLWSLVAGRFLRAVLASWFSWRYI